MLQAANIDLFNPLVPKAQNSECQSLLFPLPIKPIKNQLKRGFLFSDPSALKPLTGPFFLYRWQPLSAHLP